MVALCSAGQAHAQAAPEAPPADDAAAAPGDAIVVTGYRQSIEKSLEQKREANSLIEVITAEDIGKFPDKNVADALQRVPGVIITRDGGEGRSVSIRGLQSGRSEERREGNEWVSKLKIRWSPKQ